MVWKTLRGKPSKSIYSWEIRPKSQKGQLAETCPKSQEGQSTGAFIPPKGLVDQTTWYKRLSKFIMLEALTGIIDNMLERLLSKERKDMK